MGGEAPLPKRKDDNNGNSYNNNSNDSNNGSSNAQHQNWTKEAQSGSTPSSPSSPASVSSASTASSSSRSRKAATSSLQRPENSRQSPKSVSSHASSSLKISPEASKEISTLKGPEKSQVLEMEDTKSLAIAIENQHMMSRSDLEESLLKNLFAPIKSLESEVRKPSWIKNN
jgi:hypothetical protein